MIESWSGYSQTSKIGVDFFNPISLSLVDTSGIDLDLYGDSYNSGEDSWTYLLQAGSKALQDKKVTEKSLSDSGVLIVDYSASSQIYGEYKSRIEKSFDYMAAAAANFVCCPHGPLGYAGPGSVIMYASEEEKKKQQEAGVVSEAEQKCRSCKGRISAAQRICAPGEEKHYCTLCAKGI